MGKNSRRSRPNYRMLSDVIEEKLEWLWYPYVPKGFITNMVGIGSAGKSTITAFIASQITKGRPFVHGGVVPDTGTVVLIEDEQGAEIGVKAKMREHEADQSQIVYLDSVTNFNDEVEHFDLTKDVCALEELYVKHRDMELIIMDPVSSYMGETNCNDNSAVRRGLLPIQKFIRDRNIALIFVNHFSKNSERTIENKSLGSVAFYNVARSEILIHRELNKDENETGQVFFGLNKHNFNVGLNPPTLMYEMIDNKVCFSARTDWPNMRTIVGGGRKSRGPQQTDKTQTYKEWLDMSCGASGVVAEDAVCKAGEMGVSRSVAYRIAKELQINTNGRHNHGLWVRIGGGS
ncbi:MAG: AAA family ATPase [Planctomycetes bacterium]|nr:AAA family ATPase [Planctomycetota bacterium]